LQTNLTESKRNVIEIDRFSLEVKSSHG